MISVFTLFKNYKPKNSDKNIKGNSLFYASSQL